jgi:hypothetical protein
MWGLGMVELLIVLGLIALILLLLILDIRGS